MEINVKGERFYICKATPKSVSTFLNLEA